MTCHRFGLSLKQKESIPFDLQNKIVLIQATTSVVIALKQPLNFPLITLDYTKLFWIFSTLVLFALCLVGCYYCCTSIDEGGCFSICWFACLLAWLVGFMVVNFQRDAQRLPFLLRRLVHPFSAPCWRLRWRSFAPCRNLFGLVVWSLDIVWYRLVWLVSLCR